MPRKSNKRIRKGKKRDLPEEDITEVKIEEVLNENVMKNEEENFFHVISSVSEVSNKSGFMKNEGMSFEEGELWKYW